jgi:hypothetical protein
LQDAVHVDSLTSGPWDHGMSGMVPQPPRIKANAATRFFIVNSPGLIDRRRNAATQATRFDDNGDPAPVAL